MWHICNDFLILSCICHLVNNKSNNKSKRLILVQERLSVLFNEIKKKMCLYQQSAKMSLKISAY